MTQSPSPQHPNDLVLTRLLAAPADKLFRCWTDTALLKQWFVPSPWTIARAEVDLRPGGGSLIVMRDPDGKEYPNAGVYLEVIPNRRIVFTDAYTAGWVPSAKPFFTAIVTFEPEGTQTRLHRHRAPLDRGGAPAARGHGLSHRLGHLRRPAGSASCHAVAPHQGDCHALR